MLIPPELLGGVRPDRDTVDMAAHRWCCVVRDGATRAGWATVGAEAAANSAASQV
ncbi:hypothetical protein [Streptomyces sp. NPDC059076]|uniref:hypothetical protein n=1 Tax=unclassified Streptomyces TaxID=2593676 RepID=UPI0036B02F9F